MFKLQFVDTFAALEMINVFTELRDGVEGCTQLEGYATDFVVNEPRYQLHFQIVHIGQLLFQCVLVRLLVVFQRNCRVLQDKVVLSTSSWTKFFGRQNFQH